MVRSSAVLAALLILPTLAPAQEVAVGQQMTHEVVKGETLWALAERYLSDPFRWPLIYEANQDRISDPHWIYPGQLFVIPGIPAAAGEPAEVVGVAVVVPGQAAPPPQAPVARNLPPCPAPDGRTVFYSGSEGDRGCRVDTPPADQRTAFYPSAAMGIGGVVESEAARWVAVPRGLVYNAPWLLPWEAEIPFTGTIHRLADVWPERTSRDRATPYERVHVTLELGAQLRVGDVLQSFRVLRAEEGLGQVVQPTGILTVTAVEEGGVVAAVAAEFERVSVGQSVRRAPAYSLQPGVHPEPVESNVAASVLGFPMQREIHGFGAMAFLDVGESEGIVVGDEFSGRVNQGEGFEGLEAVRLQVVRVQGEVSTARVITLNEPILRVGTQLRLVGKMR